MCLRTRYNPTNNFGEGAKRVAEEATEEAQRKGRNWLRKGGSMCLVLKGRRECRVDGCKGLTRLLCNKLVRL